jgi:uncharacterized Zn-finger protein
MIYLLGRIDSIVHGDLYNFGLQFSYDWAVEYWVALRFIYICLAVPVIWSVFALSVSFWNKPNGKSEIVKSVKSKSVAAPVPKSESLRDNHMVISCPKCKRVFGKPLIMLDFSNGDEKARLVNVCPYCNHVLGRAEEKAEDVVVGTANSEEENREVQQR